MREPDALITAIERDFEFLRTKRRSKRFWQRITWRPRLAHVLELARWGLAIVPLVMSWGFVEGLYIASGDGLLQLGFRGLELTAIACVVLVLLGGRPACARLRRSDCIQVGASLGVALMAAVPSVLGWKFLLGLLYVVPAIAVTEPGRVGDLIVATSSMLGGFAPVGIAAVCTIDAARLYRGVRRSRVGWWDGLWALVGLLAAMLPAWLLFLATKGRML